ncbi:hypothetical protein V5O48_000366 [Marasmius crinis-equi]|uniref:Uncharacterized protein n=1 Tax=Marasmius crinis-equi TaxID=585013 RepID=A0ABR3G247_9AGAR
MSQRRLILHASALNDAEYSLYTSSLADITLVDEHDLQGHDDSYYEQMSLSLREARAWFRGRYSHIPAAVIDNILRFFSPSLSSTDNLSGGQFFAAQRLIVHAESGKEVDRSLAFVQAHPTDKPVTRPSSPPKRHTPVPSRRSTDAVVPTFVSVDNATNGPFTPPPQHPSASNNPFATLGRAKSNPGVPPSSKSHDGTSYSTPHRLPPLPPRKSVSPAVLPPPRHGSLASNTPQLVTSTMVTSKSVPTTSNTHAPVVPPKPSHFAHVTSTLMKQSLQASKTGQTMKKAEEQLERERVLQVLKSSASSPFANASASRNRSNSPNKPGSVSATPSSASGSDLERDNGSQAPPLPRRRKVSPPGSVSASSFQQVALASTSAPTASSTNPFRTSSPSFDSKSQKSAFSSTSKRLSSSPTHQAFNTPSTPNLPPPKHPDQSYRKPPPPPIPSSSLIAGGFTEASDTIFSDRSQSGYPRVPYTAHPTNFAPEPIDTISSSVAAKSASPYVSAFTPETTPNATPTKNGINDESLSPTTRLFRSKSMHQPASPTSPFSPVDDSPGRSQLPPPVRRKRPESVQVVSGSPFGSGSSSRNESSQTFDAHRRESSNQDASRSHDPLHLRSLAASLQPQLQQIQPKLDKARYKAEAGLSRRGFIVNPKTSKRKEDQEGLMSGEEQVDVEEDDSRNPYRQARRNRDRTRAVSESGAAGWDDNVVYSDSDSDGETDTRKHDWGNQGTIRGRRVGSVPHDLADQDHLRVEKDHLKWPVGEGEGWRRL